MRTALTLFWVGSLLTPLRGFNFFPFALDPPITLIRWTKEAGLSWSNDIIRWEPIYALLISYAVVPIFLFFHPFFSLFSFFFLLYLGFSPLLSSIIYVWGKQYQLCLSFQSHHPIIHQERPCRKEKSHLTRQCHLLSQPCQWMKMKKTIIHAL